MKKLLRFIRNNWILLTIFAFMLFARLYRLGWDESNDDAVFWLERAKKLILFWQNGNFSIMPDYQYPGVPVYFITGVFLKLAEIVIKNIRDYTFPLHDANYFPVYNFFGKLPIQGIYLIFSGYFYLGVKKIFNNKIALISLALLVMEPFNLGVTRFIHAEGYLSAFIGTLFISYLLYLKTKTCYFLIPFSIFSALAFATKYTAFPIVLVIYSHFFYTSLINKQIKRFAFVCLITVVSFLLSYPAFALNPVNTIKETALALTTRALKSRNSIPTWYFYIASMFVRFSLIFFFGYVWGIKMIIGKIKYVLHVSIFLKIPVVVAVSFIMFLSFFNQKIDRYIITIFPIIAILIGYVLNNFFEYIKNPAIKRLMIFAGLLYYVFLFALLTPTYSSYYNKAFGGFDVAKRALGAEMVGEGMFIISRDLNLEEKPYDLSVLVRPTFTSFKPFFKGKTFGPSDYIPENINLDYVIIKSGNAIPNRYLNLCQLNKTYYLYFSPIYDLYKCQN